MLGSDINCGLKKINEIKKTVGKLRGNFISGADSQEINGVEIYRKFGFTKIVSKDNGAVPLPLKILK